MAALATAYGTLKAGTLWASTGKCRGFATANPGEAAQIDDYVAALDRGEKPTPPVLTTATGRGIVGMLAALVGAASSPPPPPSSSSGAKLRWAPPGGMVTVIQSETTVTL